MEQLFDAELPNLRKPMVAPLPRGKGPRELQCIECGLLTDAKTMIWINSDLKPPTVS
jgi:hypothetical protein